MIVCFSVCKCVRCPPPGRQGLVTGSAILLLLGVGWVLAVSCIISEACSCRKSWTKSTGVPLSRIEYMDWFTKDCPPYMRLDEDTADAFWKRDFANPNIHRDQVESNDKKGRSTGLVSRMQYCMHICHQPAQHVLFTSN